MSHDPISSTGPSLCVDVASIKDNFPNTEEVAASRSVATMAEKNQKEDENNPNVLCRFVCQMDKHSGHKYKQSKKTPCVDSTGRKVDVRVGPVKRGKCIYSSFDPRGLVNSQTAMQKEAKKLCKEFTQKEGLQDGVGKTCGYKVTFEEQLVDKDENWEASKDSTFRLGGVLRMGKAAADEEVGTEEQDTTGKK